MNVLKDEFLEILANYQGILHKVSMVYFHRSEDRRDNFQEIVYQLWKAYPKLRNRNSVGSWIYAIAINTSISKLKKQTRIEYRNYDSEIPDPVNSLQQLFMEEETKLLLQAISLLNDIDKSIMFLYLEEKSYDEIASILGMTVTNIGARISRAKKMLKRNLNLLNYGK